MSEALLQFGQQLSGALQIPLVRLFGQSPAGLNSTGESDLRTYYDGIAQQQASTLLVPMSNIVIMTALSMGKKIPDDFSVVFRPLWQLSEEQKSEVASRDTTSVLDAEERGIITQKHALQELKQQSKTTGRFSNITDEDVEAASDELPPRGEEAIAEQQAQMEHQASLEGGDDEDRNDPKEPKSPKGPRDRSRDSAKLMKSAVDYSPGMGEELCGNCRHYVGGGACEVVAGSIDVAYWCEKFDAGLSYDEEGVFTTSPNGLSLTPVVPTPDAERGNNNSGIAHLGKSGSGSSPCCGRQDAYMTLGRSEFESTGLRKCKTCETIAARATRLAPMKEKVEETPPWGLKPARDMTQSEIRGWLAKKPKKLWREVLEQVLSMKIMRNEDAQPPVHRSRDSLPISQWMGLDVAIESMQGTIRRGENWSSVQPADYGYIRRMPSAEGETEWMDCYLSSVRSQGDAYVVDGYTPEGRFDEHKVMLGYKTQADALRDYHTAYGDGRRAGGITPMSILALRGWMKSGDVTRPLAARNLRLAANGG
jgi:hypothetical protein